MNFETKYSIGDRVGYKTHASKCGVWESATGIMTIEKVAVVANKGGEVYIRYSGTDANGHWLSVDGECVFTPRSERLADDILKMDLHADKAREELVKLIEAAYGTTQWERDRKWSR